MYWPEITWSTDNVNSGYTVSISSTYDGDKLSVKIDSSAQILGSCTIVKVNAVIKPKLDTGDDFDTSVGDKWFQLIYSTESCPTTVSGFELKPTPVVGDPKLTIDIEQPQVAGYVANFKDAAKSSDR